MSTVVPIEVGLTKSRIIGNLPPDIFQALRDQVSFKSQGYFFSPQYKRGLWDGRKHLVTEKGQQFATGLVGRVSACLGQLGYETQIIDNRYLGPPAQFMPVLAGEPLRDYQKGAVEKMIAAGMGTCRIATGGGKTRVGIAIIADLERPALFLVHRRDLMHQTLKVLRAVMQYPELVGQVGDGIYEPNMVTVATIQTICAALNIKPDKDEELEDVPETGAAAHRDEIEKMLETVEVVIGDECFPAGTLVDGKPIEEYHVGDSLIAFDESTKTTKLSYVTHVFEKIAESLLTVTAGGFSVRCTPNHPFFTNRGWIEAQNLTTDDFVYRVQHACSHKDQTSTRSVLPRRSSVLFPEVRTSVHQQELLQDNGAHESTVCLGAHDRAESDEQSGNTRENVYNPQDDRTPTEGSRRQWNRANPDATSPVDCNGLGVDSRVCPANADSDGRKSANGLQNRPGSSGREDCSRDRRRLALHHSSTSARSQEDPMLRAVRVDSIEVYEPGDQGTITGGRRVHRVYNLEVAEQNTYIAEGFVVHNCHHAPASTIYKVLEKIKNAPYRIGLSATDWRDDGADLMIEAAFGPRIVDIDLSALIAWGYLVQPEIWMHEMAKPTEKLSARSNRNWNSVYSHFITHNEPYHQQVVEQAREWYWNGRTVLTLVERVQHGKILAEMMNERGMPTVFLSGKDSPDVRMRTFEAVMDGQLRSLVATSIADEGLDLPALDALILAGGSKSSTRAYQRIGRILRLYKNKEKGLVADYRCRDHEWLDEHARRRLSIYKKEKAFEVHFKR